MTVTNFFFQTYFNNTENIENENVPGNLTIGNVTNNEIETVNISHENESSQDEEQEEPSEIVVENNDLELTYKFLRFLSKWTKLTLEKKDDDLTLVIEGAKMQSLLNNETL